jgi:hypothetical protein
VLSSIDFAAHDTADEGGDDGRQKRASDSDIRKEGKKKRSSTAATTAATATTGESVGASDAALPLATHLPPSGFMIGEYIGAGSVPARDDESSVAPASSVDNTDAAASVGLWIQCPIGAISRRYLTNNFTPSN